MDKLKSLLEEEDISYQEVEEPTKALKVGSAFAYYSDHFGSWIVDYPLKSRTFDNENDIFVHYSEIDQDGFKELEENDRVEFEPVQTEDGLQAHDVIRIGQEEAMA